MTSKSMTKRLYIQNIDKFEKFLIEKNISYDNSFIKPSRFNIPIETRLLTRIEDKLNRLESDNNYDNEDTEKDLIGYLILLSTYLSYKDVMDETNANDYIKENCNKISSLYIQSGITKKDCIKSFVESPVDIENLNFIIAKLVLEKENIIL